MQNCSDVHAPGKYKQECNVARRYWDRTLLRVALGVAWNRSPNAQAERNLKEGYRLLFRTDPLLRACLEINSPGVLLERGATVNWIRRRSSAVLAYGHATNARRAERQGRSHGIF